MLAYHQNPNAAAITPASITPTARLRQGTRCAELAVVTLGGTTGGEVTGLRLKL